jgi:hypothetical protein
MTTPDTSSAALRAMAATLLALAGEKETAQATPKKRQARWDQLGLLVIVDTDSVIAGSHQNHAGIGWWAWDGRPSNSANVPDEAAGRAWVEARLPDVEVVS